MTDHQFIDPLKKQQRKPAAEGSPGPTHEQPLTRLQGVVGNRGIQRLLAERGGDVKRAAFIQTKLTVGAADDAYEHEADQVAHDVMTMRDPNIQRAEEDELAAKRVDVQRAEEDELAAKRVDGIQRAEEDELAAKRVDGIQRAEEDELAAKRMDVQRAEEDELAAKHVDMMDSFDVGSDVEGKINSSKGSGEGLPDTAREFFEPRFGQDFSDVKVHAGSESDNLNRSISARAFTSGNDIFFRDGEYNPDNSSGRELLAHELTHVVQQTGGKAQAKRTDDAT
jgi:hypothetical protein